MRVLIRILACKKERELAQTAKTQDEQEDHTTPNAVLLTYMIYVFYKSYIGWYKIVWAISPYHFCWPKR
jgi:hypothetical protein